MRALSGLTPALSRRLQQQLLAHLPPAAARSLRRTLSLHSAPASPASPAYTRSHSAGKHNLHSEPLSTQTTDAANNSDVTSTASDVRNTASEVTSDHPDSVENQAECPPNTESCEESARTPARATTPPTKSLFTRKPSEERDPAGPAPSYCTLPRLRRRSSSPPREEPRPASRAAADRPLLSKYLTPERTLSLDESYSSDSGSILSEPSYIAAYGSGSGSGLSLRRHSLRLTGDQPRKRISRFLRSDFFDSPTDESLYAKHKKEKELETQKILREIREKKNKSLDAATIRSPTDVVDQPVYGKDELSFPRKSLSPIGLLTGKDRSRSNTPFFPILDNIKETTLDTSLIADSKHFNSLHETKNLSRLEENIKESKSKLMRPKSYPVKTLDSIDEPSENMLSDTCSGIENKDKSLQRESKLIRPKSYPTSSPSPEKIYINRNIKKDDNNSIITRKEEVVSPGIQSDVEVSFSITLPKKTKTDEVTKNCPKNSDDDQNKLDNVDKILIKKYKILSNDEVKPEVSQQKVEKVKAITNGVTNEAKQSVCDDDSNKTNSNKKVETKSKATEPDSSEKKPVKKKIIKKVSSKSKTDLGNSSEVTNATGLTEKKKVTKKIKPTSSTDDGTKSTTAPKKKSVLQSIGHKLEKFASNKSSSPEKKSESASNAAKRDSVKLTRTQREKSVPVSAEPPTESNLIKRAVTLTDVAALDNQNTSQNKTTVSKVLGLFKKFEPKEKPKPVLEKSQSECQEDYALANCETELPNDLDTVGKPRRPTSLLLNGLGRKSKYGRTSSDSVSSLTAHTDEQTAPKNDKESKNMRNSLKLDFSRLPRVKKIVPTNPVIEPQIMNFSSSNDNGIDKKEILDKKASLLDNIINVENGDPVNRSRSRSTISNSEVKSDVHSDAKQFEKSSLSPSNSTTHQPVRKHESTTPEKEDIVDRIRRKSFYSRFNEKKQRRKSSLVGPGAAEYDPLARIHGQPAETKYDASPTSPGTASYDLSPGLSISSDVSPSTERYRSLLSDIPGSTRSNLKYDTYGLNDKIDTYRSLDRNDFRKYPSRRSYLDYDQPTSYGTNKYSRTKSLLDGSDASEDNLVTSIRDPHKFNRTISMYSPGNYATYRPKRTRNSAIILKESEKEPSPENILDKIRQRKNISISVTRKPDPEKELLSRSNITPKGESDGTECSEKGD